MAPPGAIATRVEMFLSGLWTNITSDVYKRGDITVTRGRADEASTADPSELALTLNNRLGKYSPRNPASPYFGVIGRNTPVRFGVGVPPLGVHSALVAPGTSHPAPSITAEQTSLLISVWAASSVGNYTLPGGYTTSPELDGGVSTVGMGYKSVGAGATGVQSATFSVSPAYATTASVVIPGGTFIQSYAALSTNGADISFPTDPAAVGEYLVAVHVWSLDPMDRMQCAPRDRSPAHYASSAWLLVSDSGPSETSPRVKVYVRRVNTAGAQTTNFEGTFGEVGGVTADTFVRVYRLSAVADYFPRFTGEASSFPSRWDLSGRDVWVPLQASGITRRLGQGSAPPRSAIEREILDATSVLAYWPMEDGEGSTRFASAVDGVEALRFLGATPALAADDTFIASGPLPTFTLGGAAANMATYTSTGQFVVAALVAIPETGMTDETTLMALRTTGTASLWTVKYDAAGPNFRVQAYTSAGTEIANNTSGAYTPTLPGSKFQLMLRAKDNGANIDFQVLRVVIPADLSTPSAQSSTGSITTQSVGAVTSVGVGVFNDLTGAPTMGHLAVSGKYSAFFSYSVYEALQAYNGEFAGTRFKRLCTEAGVPAALHEGASEQRMGPQRLGAFLDRLGEIETTDGGAIFEPRGLLGLAYRARGTKQSQAPAVTLSYTGGNVSPPFDPTDDDQNTVNDVTVTREGGSKARAVLQTGALSVNPPPAGVGRYDTELTLSTDSDDRLLDQAGWRLHLGTWDEARYPQMRVDLARNPALTTTVATQEIGDLTTVTGLPAWLPPGPVDLLLEGYTETFTYPRQWDLIGNYSPGGAYRVLIADSATHGRLDSTDSTLASAATTTATSLSVAVASGSPLWVTTALNPGEFPFLGALDGEDVTVTAITGTTSPQTFTVTRSVNAIVKAHPGGTQIRLADPVVLAM